jgi:ACS family sodium-dependent inorganic phosphate cotransporter
MCFLAAFVCYIDRVNISVAAIAMQEEFGWSETVKGLVLSAFFVGYMIFQVPSGWLASRHGGKLVLGAAVLWWSVFTILTPAAAAISLPLLVTARIALGLGESATFPASWAVLGRWVPAEERSRAVALCLSGIPLGTLFALTATGWLITRYGWPSVFYAFGAVGLVWTMFWAWWIHDDPRRHPSIGPDERALLEEIRLADDDAKLAVPWKHLLQTRAFWALFVNHFCSNWALYVLLTWLPSYFRSTQNLSIANAGLYSAAPWLTMFVMSNVAGWIADSMIRRGVDLTRVRKLMQCTGLIGPAVFLLLARGAESPNEAMLLMCGALGTLAFTWAGYAVNHLEIAPRHAPVLIGVTNTAGTVPGIIGVSVTGWLVDVTGTYASAFVLAAAVCVIGAVIWLAFATSKRVID